MVRQAKLGRASRVKGICSRCGGVGASPWNRRDVGSGWKEAPRGNARTPTGPRQASGDLCRVRHDDSRNRDLTEKNVISYAAYFFTAHKVSRKVKGK